MVLPSPANVDGGAGVFADNLGRRPRERFTSRGERGDVRVAKGVEDWFTMSLVLARCRSSVLPSWFRAPESILLPVFPIIIRGFIGVA
jgi:hypothetical protein